MHNESNVLSNNAVIAHPSLSERNWELDALTLASIVIDRSANGVYINLTLRTLNAGFKEELDDFRLSELEVEFAALVELLLILSIPLSHLGVSETNHLITITVAILINEYVAQVRQSRFVS